MFKMPTYLKNTPGSQSLGRQRSRATPGNKICNNVFCQLNEIVGINNNVCAFLCSVCTCQPVQHSWRRWRGSPGTSWCCGHLASQPRSIFSPRSRTRSRPRLPSVSPAQRVSPIRCKQLGAQNQVHTGRCSQVLQGGGGKDLACERRPASSPVGAAFEATATSRRQLSGLKALHILKKKTIKVSRILKKETFKPSTIPHSEEEENNKKVPSKYDLCEAARFYSALKRKY